MANLKSTRKMLNGMQQFARQNSRIACLGYDKIVAYQKIVNDLITSDTPLSDKELKIIADLAQETIDLC